jgi:hypothetical protein
MDLDENHHPSHQTRIFVSSFHDDYRNKQKNQKTKELLYINKTNKQKFILKKNTKTN